MPSDIAAEMADEIILRLRTEPMDDNMPQQQREALKALEWIEHIIDTESGAPADVALEVLRGYVSRPVNDNYTLPAILHRCGNDE